MAKDRRKGRGAAVPAVPVATPEDMTTRRASVASDPAYRAFLGGLVPEDPILKAKGGGKGWEIYDDLLLDPRAFTVWEKRIRAVLAYPWEVLPASQSAADLAIAAETRAMLEAVGFDQVTEDAMAAVWFGFTCLEVVWGYRSGRLVPERVVPIPHRRVRFGEDWRPRILTRENAVTGEEVPDRKFLTMTYGSRTSPYGRGVAARAWWPVFFKKQGVRYWLAFAEKYGAPTAVGKARRGATEPERQRLLEAIERISQDAGVVLEEGEAVELLESASKSGSIEAFSDLVSWCDDQVSEMVLGETGTTNQSKGGGSRARDQVGNEVRLEVAQADANRVNSGPVADLVRWFVEVNFPGSAAPRVRRVVEAPKDTKLLAERDKVLAECGWERTDAGFVEAYGEGYQRRAAGPLQAAPAVAAAPGPSFAEAQPVQTLPPALAGLGGTLRASSPAAFDPLVTAAERLLDECSSLSEFLERLPELVKVEAPGLVRLLEEGALAASLAGMVGVKDGR